MSSILTNAVFNSHTVILTVLILWYERMCHKSFFSSSSFCLELHFLSWLNLMLSAYAHFVTSPSFWSCPCWVYASIIILSAMLWTPAKTEKSTIFQLKQFSSRLWFQELSRGIWIFPTGCLKCSAQLTCCLSEPVNTEACQLTFEQFCLQLVC